MGEKPKLDSSLKTLVPSLSIILPVHQPDNSMMPFVHALKLAYASKGELEIVDVRREEEAIEHIGVRDLLEKWGILPGSSSRSDVGEIGLRIKKIVKTGNKKAEIIKRLKRHSHDILVIGTQSSSRIGTLLGRNLAEYLAVYFRRITLFIPSGARPFVDMGTGNVNLRNIVIPVESPSFFSLMTAQLKKILSLFPESNPRIIGLKCGNCFPEPDPSLLENIHWETELHRESMAHSILSSARKHSADLIVMADNGRHTLLQKLIGNNTEQVLRYSECPVLSVSVQEN
ncbi:MAG: universal stress protein [Fibrobacter sp.]|nr:universal stress protein [Fibrobacter sp.]HON11932.1 universal stress protein [Chitinispirillaceae bacterium]